MSLVGERMLMSDRHSMNNRYNFCCGKDLSPFYLNVDRVDFGQDIVSDIEEDWDFIPVGSAREIFIKDGLEHLDDPQLFFKRAGESLMVGGFLVVEVPHFKAPSAYRVSHKNFFSYSSFFVYPESFDVCQNLFPVSIELRLQNGLNFFNPFINLFPRFWEKVGYVESMRVVFEKR